MVCFLLTKAGVYNVDGIPDVFVESSEFSKLMEDEELQKKLCNNFHRDIKVAVLGKLEDGVYNVPKYEPTLAESKGGANRFYGFI